MRVYILPVAFVPKKDAKLEELTQDWAPMLIHDIGASMEQMLRVLNGNVGFGDGTDFDNLKGKWLTYSTNASPDTEDTVTHDLGSVPVGFLTMEPPEAGYLYKGPTPWTTTAIFLKCSAAAQTAKIFVLLN